MKKTPEIDYVELYAKKLLHDPSLFKDQKMLIDSQIKSSRELFRKRFGEGEEFKKNARIYLKEMGMI
jgi:hypothetical protein